MELALTNRTLSAREAEQMGLITRVVPDSELQQQAEKIATDLSQGATRAFGGVKRLLYASATTPLDEQMEIETEWIADSARSWDAQEGIAAFLAKRPPKFNGN
jgi:2-(1,2-epoxy-1,2-dihydrophenyl)acetyl-CoA isomerase